MLQRIDRTTRDGLIEWELRRVPRLGRAAVYGLGLLLVGALVAAYLVRIPETASARGLIRAAEGTVLVEAERAGTVVRIGAREGDVVHAGQVLLELDSREIRATLRLEEERLARLKRESSEIEKILAALRVPGIPIATLDLYAKRYENILEEYHANRLRWETAVRERDRYEELERSDPGAVSRMELQKKRDEARLAEMTMRTALGAHRSSLEGERHRLAREELEGRVRRLALDRDLARTRIAASAAGRVSFGAVREVGAFVQSGQRLFVLEGKEMGWVLEAWLPAGSAGHVSEGMSARVGLSAFPTVEYGTVAGAVVEVSPDSRGGEHGGMRRVRIRLRAGELRGPAGRGFVTLGMDGEAKIVVRERRLLFRLVGELDSVL